MLRNWQFSEELGLAYSQELSLPHDTKLKQPIICYMLASHRKVRIV